MGYGGAVTCGETYFDGSFTLFLILLVFNAAQKIPFGIRTGKVH